jgi:hypothetical protein
VLIKAKNSSSKMSYEYYKIRIWDGDFEFVEKFVKKLSMKKLQKNVVDFYNLSAYTVNKL